MLRGQSFITRCFAILEKRVRVNHWHKNIFRTLFRRLESAPRLSNILTISDSPFMHARCSGVFPFYNTSGRRNGNEKTSSLVSQHSMEPQPSTELPRSHRCCRNTPSGGLCSRPAMVREGYLETSISVTYILRD
jgi:hypothetical protein